MLQFRSFATVLLLPLSVDGFGRDDKDDRDEVLYRANNRMANNGNSKTHLANNQGADSIVVQVW